MLISSLCLIFNSEFFCFFIHVDEAKRDNYHANKRIIYWPPFWNKVYRRAEKLPIPWMIQRKSWKRVYFQQEKQHGGQWWRGWTFRNKEFLLYWQLPVLHQRSSEVARELCINWRGLNRFRRKIVLFSIHRSMREVVEKWFWNTCCPLSSRLLGNCPSKRMFICTEHTLHRFVSANLNFAWGWVLLFVQELLYCRFWQLPMLPLSRSDLQLNYHHHHRHLLTLIKFISQLSM